MNMIDRKPRFLPALVSAVLLTSCGTSAYVSSNGFANNIYQQPEQNINISKSTRNVAYIDDLKADTERTIRQYASAAAVQINSSTTVVPLAKGETFEERLTKFDSPEYTININVTYEPWYAWWNDFYWSWSYWYNPFWDWYPYSYRYYWGYGGWWRPWYGPSWHAPYYNPWYGFWDPWYWDPWPGYWPGYIGHHHHIHHPVWHGRDVYYGKRDNNSIRRPRNDRYAGNIRSGASEPVYKRTDKSDIKTSYTQLRGLAAPRTGYENKTSTGNAVYSRTVKSASGNSQSAINRNNAITQPVYRRAGSGNGTGTSYQRKSSASNTVKYTDRNSSYSRSGNGYTRSYNRTGSSSSSDYRRSGSATYTRSSGSTSRNSSSFTRSQSQPGRQTYTRPSNSNSRQTFTRSNSSTSRQSYSRPSSSGFNRSSAASSAGRSSGGGSVYRRR